MTAAAVAGPRPVFYITGGDGDLTACALTGEVLERDEDPRGRPVYPGIRRVNVDEWQAFYPDRELAGMSIDSLDLETIDRNGRASPPEYDFRLELALIDGDGDSARDLSQFSRLEVDGCVNEGDAISGGETPDRAEFFGVYGREHEADGIALAVHLFDTPTHAGALRLAEELANGALPVCDVTGDRLRYLTRHAQGA